MFKVTDFGLSCSAYSLDLDKHFVALNILFTRVLYNFYLISKERCLHYLCFIVKWESVVHVSLIVFFCHI